jgi:hypothetical protein
MAPLNTMIVNGAKRAASQAIRARTHSITKITAIFAFVIILSGCIFDHRSIKIDGPYELLWIDAKEHTHICYQLEGGGCVGRIPAEVVAYGSNGAYITAYRKDVGYYYLERAKDDKYADPQASVTGPLDEATFQQLKTKLGLPALRDVPW